MTKPLFDKGSSSPVTAVNTKAPAPKVGALDFSSVKESELTQRMEKNRSDRDEAVSVMGRALQFSTPEQAPAVPQKVTGRKDPTSPLFPEGAPHPAFNEVVVELRTNFDQLYRVDGDRINRYVKRLLPLTADVAINWGDTVLKAVGDMSTTSSKLAKRFAEARGDELMREALEEANKDGGIFGRMLGKGISNVKPRLAGLKALLTTMLPECEGILNDIDGVRDKALCKMASFSCVYSVMAGSLDNAVDTAASNRRVILQQSTAQIEMTKAQLQQLRTLLVDQISRVDQLLFVTIPAMEAAKG